MNPKLSITSDQKVSLLILQLTFAFRSSELHSQATNLTNQTFRIFHSEHRILGSIGFYALRESIQALLVYFRLFMSPKVFKTSLWIVFNVHDELQTLHDCLYCLFPLNYTVLPLPKLPMWDSLHYFCSRSVVFIHFGYTPSYQNRCTVYWSFNRG